MDSSFAERLLVDGSDDLDRLGPIELELSCPSCRAVSSVDAVRLVRTTSTTFAATSNGDLGLDELREVAAATGVELATFDGVPFLRSPDGLAVHLASWSCTACGRPARAVLCWGEFQPGRWQLGFRGVVRAHAVSPGPAPSTARRRTTPPSA